MLENSRADTTAIPARSPKSHPLVGGRFDRVDGRSAAARRAKQLAAEYVAALGGPDAVDAVLMARVKRASELVVVAERTRVLAMQGEAVLDDLVRVERLAELAMKRLGLERRAREAAKGPTLEEYLASKHGTAA